MRLGLSHKYAPFFAVLLSILPLDVEAQGRTGRNTPERDALRETCRQEARRTQVRGRTGRIDSEQLKALRREHVRDCMKREGGRS